MRNRQEIRERQAQHQRLQRILIIAGVALAVILLVVFLVVPAFLPSSSGPLARPQAKFNQMGDPNAPVKIIEYSDFQCPYCAKFSNETEAKIVEAYVATGKVYFEYRSFGEFIGPESLRAAEAAYCAGDQEKFWEMHDLIFANQGGENVGAYSDQRLQELAQKAGLEIEAFNACFTNRKYAERVKQDQVDGIQAGVEATPSFVINGKLIVGAQPFEAFQAEIEALLK